MRTSTLKRLLIIVIIQSIAVLYLLHTADTQLNKIASLCVTDGRIHDSKCEVIHIAIVCVGHDAVRAVSRLVKSLLASRKNPLHLHFQSDNVTRLILTTLFNTWMIPQVDTSIYSTEDTERLAPWAASTHDETRNELLKIMFASFLPHHVKQVIVLDPDTVILVDIAELWNQFVVTRCRTAVAIGLVGHRHMMTQQLLHISGSNENQGRTEVIWLQLDTLRQLNWTQMVLDSRATGQMHGDLLDTIIKQHLSIVYTLPSEWSVSLVHVNNGVSSLPAEARIIRMLPDATSPLDNGETATKHLNATLNCTATKRTLLNDKLDLLNRSEECYETHRDALRVRRTHLFYLDYESSSSEDVVTLITQLSAERLYMLELLCTHWKGPMSIALYFSDAAALAFPHHVLSSLCLKSRSNIAFHVVFKEGVCASLLRNHAAIHVLQKFYPTNYLRNVALGQAATPYVYLADADFLPVPTLYDYLRVFLSNGSSKEHTKKAYVVPAFENLKPGVKRISNKSQLSSMLRDGQVQGFKAQIFREGHGPTNISRWLVATLPYKVQWMMFYEPYIVVSRDVDKYDERFVGYGRDKISHVMKLNWQGFEFVVLPDVFMVHIAHPKSNDELIFRSSQLLMKCNKMHQAALIDELTNPH